MGGSEDLESLKGRIDEGDRTYLIVVVKKTFRYSNVFFYNHLCRTSVFRNIIMENGIISGGLTLSGKILNLFLVIEDENEDE